MSGFFEHYINMVVVQRDWSWALVAALYFVVILILRNILFKPLIQAAKTLDRKSYHEIKTNYLNKCSAGWFLLLGSTAAVAVAWFREIAWPLTIAQGITLLLALIGSILSILFHLIAFSHACLAALKKAEESQKIL